MRRARSNFCTLFLYPCRTCRKKRGLDFKYFKFYLQNKKLRSDSCDKTQDVWMTRLRYELSRSHSVRLLARRIDSEAPKGRAKPMWVQCVKALTSLIKQSVTKVVNGNITSHELYDQLTMIANCLPILLLRVSPLATHNTKQQIMLSLSLIHI